LLDLFSPSIALASSGHQAVLLYPGSLLSKRAISQGISSRGRSKETKILCKQAGKGFNKRIKGELSLQDSNRVTVGVYHDFGIIPAGDRT
jgi:hypothetical protein